MSNLKQDRGSSSCPWCLSLMGSVRLPDVAAMPRGVMVPLSVPTGCHKGTAKALEQTWLVRVFLRVALLEVSHNHQACGRVAEWPAIGPWLCKQQLFTFSGALHTL